MKLARKMEPPKMPQETLRIGLGSIIPQFSNEQ